MGCNERLGWYYVRASDSSQKYKEGMHFTAFYFIFLFSWPAIADGIIFIGKYLFERAKILKDNAWKLDGEDF